MADSEGVPFNTGPSRAHRDTRQSQSETGSRYYRRPSPNMARGGAMSPYSQRVAPPQTGIPSSSLWRDEDRTSHHPYQQSYYNRRNWQSESAGSSLSYEESSTRFWSPPDRPARPMILVSGSSMSGSSRHSGSLNFRRQMRWRSRPDPDPVPVSPSASTESSSGSSDDGYSPSTHEASVREMDRFPAPPPTLAMPRPSISYPRYDQQQFFAHTAPPTPTGYQHPAPMQFIPQVPNVVPPEAEVPSSVPQQKQITQAQFTLRLVSEHVSKYLTEVGFDTDNKGFDAQLALITQTFYVVERKHTNVKWLPDRATFMADGLRRIARSIENKLHLVVFNQGLDKLGSYFARMSVPPGANGPLDIGSSGWMSYTAENARALGGERGTPLTDRLFLHGQVNGATRWYENPEFKEIIIKFLFSEASSLGNFAPEWFQTITPTCFAYFVLMTINEFEFACLDQRRSEVFELTDELFEQFIQIRDHIIAHYHADPLFRLYLDNIAKEGRERFLAAKEQKSAEAKAARKERKRLNKARNMGHTGFTSGPSSSLAGALG